jgi:hypothetical protein
LRRGIAVSGVAVPGVGVGCLPCVTVPVARIAIALRPAGIARIRVRRCAVRVGLWTIAVVLLRSYTLIRLLRRAVNHLLTGHCGTCISIARLLRSAVGVPPVGIIEPSRLRESLRGPNIGLGGRLSAATPTAIAVAAAPTGIVRPSAALVPAALVVAWPLVIRPILAVAHAAVSAPASVRRPKSACAAISS